MIRQYGEWYKVGLREVGALPLGVAGGTKFPLLRAFSVYISPPCDYLSPRRGWPRVQKFCIGYILNKILGIWGPLPPSPRTMQFLGGQRGVFSKVFLGFQSFGYDDFWGVWGYVSRLFCRHLHGKISACVNGGTSGPVKCAQTGQGWIFPGRIFPLVIKSRKKFWWKIMHFVTFSKSG